MSNSCWAVGFRVAFILLLMAEVGQCSFKCWNLKDRCESRCRGWMYSCKHGTHKVINPGQYGRRWYGYETYYRGGYCCVWDESNYYGAVFGIVFSIIAMATIITIISCLFCATCPYYRYRQPAVVVPPPPAPVGAPPPPVVQEPPPLPPPPMVMAPQPVMVYYV